MKMRTADYPPERVTYRHGDLRRALVDAGMELAREGGGPQAVVLREATRRAGVVPNAAYRHFASRAELLAAVRSAALAELALAIEAELAAVRPRKDRAAYARASLRAVGTAYLRFALTEPGLFRVAFTAESMAGGGDPAKAGKSGLDPFELLGSALDRMLEAGILPAERRPGAEYLAWSAVHGLAMLVLDGPLRAFMPQQMEAVGQHVVEMVVVGLTA